ncbi:MAG: DNA polymerase I [Acidobacteria bacterium]|nr:DNA polymerase I [Acidobacteriota bacterium]
MSAPFFLDTETFSKTDIRNGTDNYARDAEIMIWTYARGDRPVVAYDATTGARMPSELEDNLLDERVTLIAHNATFDRTVLHFNGFPTPAERWQCTMAHALAHSLPGGLDKLCEIFKVADDMAKLKDGKALVHLFCKPRPKNMKLRRATRETHPAEWARFVEYAINDVAAMREVRRLMPNWNYGTESETALRELDLWHMDQNINRSGVLVDIDLVNGAITTAERAKSLLAVEANELSEGAIEATTQRDALLRLLSDVYDVWLPDLRGANVERLLASDHNLPEVVVSLLNNRLSASSTSVSKYKKFKQLTGPDNRLRNTIQFCGAMRTGRDAGRGVQLQNLPRPTLKQSVIEAGIAAIKADCADLVFDDPMRLLSSAVRGCLIAPPGKKLVVADLSNIEGRFLAWLAGETWKLQAFADFDTCMGVDGNWYTGDQIRDAVLSGNPVELKLDKKGEPTRKGYDLYALAYSKAFRITPEAVMENKSSGDGSFRQIGKVMELALGYEGGVGAFVTFAVAYGIDLDQMAEGAAGNIPERIWREAERAHEWAVKTKRDYGMKKKTYVVCDSFKRLWREAHPETVGFWKELEQAFRLALDTPGRTFYARKISATKLGAWMTLTLPSGRKLCYPSPRYDENGKLSYMGINQFSRQWNRLKTYSGKLAENVTQAGSRDVLKAPVRRILDYGYEIKIPVHDEQITEAVDLPCYSDAHLAALMSDNPAWAKGLPLAAAGFESNRYRKD